jgi:hypothetical protein
MTDSVKEHLRKRLASLAEEAQATGLAARLYSPDVLVVCLPLDAPTETPQTPRSEGATPERGERRKSGTGGGEGTLL